VIVPGNRQPLLPVMEKYQKEGGQAMSCRRALMGSRLFMGMSTHMQQ